MICAAWRNREIRKCHDRTGKDPLEEFDSEMRSGCVCDTDLEMYKVSFYFSYDIDDGEHEYTYQIWPEVTIHDDLAEMKYWEEEI